MTEKASEPTKTDDLSDTELDLRASRLHGTIWTSKRSYQDVTLCSLLFEQPLKAVARGKAVDNRQQNNSRLRPNALSCGVSLVGDVLTAIYMWSVR